MIMTQSDAAIQIIVVSLLLSVLILGESAHFENQQQPINFDRKR